MLCDYEFVRKWSKIFTYGCSGAIVALGMAKFFNVTNVMNPIDYIVNVYLLFLGLVLFTCECGWERILKYFNFLRYFFGKAFYVIFVGLLCFNQNYWFQILVSVFLFSAAVLYIILGFTVNI